MKRDYGGFPYGPLLLALFIFAWEILIINPLLIRAGMNFLGEGFIDMILRIAR